jgi:hypothetical protein
MAGVFTLRQAYTKQLTDNSNFSGFPAWPKETGVTFSQGWWGGGYGPANRTDVYRMDFANDTVSPNVRGPLPTRAAIATGNKDYGWFLGYLTSTQTLIYRVEYQNDFATASTRGATSAGRYGGSGGGNKDFGYMAKGYKGAYPTSGGSTTVNRITYSNDLASTTSVGNLATDSFRGAVTGNVTYLWWMGGNTGAGSAGGFTSNIDRLTFSSDLSAASPRGVLSSARYSMYSHGNNSYGWIIGGSLLPYGGVTTVDRIDFGSDLSTASVRGLMPTNTTETTAGGNRNYLWAIGGGVQGTPYKSNIYRLNFSNDLVAVGERSYLPIAQQSLQTGFHGHFDY